MPLRECIDIFKMLWLEQKGSNTKRIQGHTDSKNQWKTHQLTKDQCDPIDCLFP